jgi:dihydroorotase
MVKNAITRLPGLVDVHVHLRTPGGEHKEDIRSGSAAALAGGFTSILAMPNTLPPLVTLSDFRAAEALAKTQAACDLRHFAGASADHLDALPLLAREAVGLKIYMDQTYGPLRTASLVALMTCFKQWPKQKPIAVHAEGLSLAVVIGLAAAYRRSVHICHVSRREEVQLIAAARQQGLAVTCEVTPHHLFLTDADVPRLGPLGDMRPRLATREDVNVLWAHLGTVIDCIATDHAPHTLEEKQSESPPPGVPGLETALPLMLTAVAEGRLGMEQLVALMATQPRRIFGLPEQPDTWVDVEMGGPYIIDNGDLYTKCGWSPFVGMDVRARVRSVRLRGKVVFERAGEPDDHELTPPNAVVL